MSSTIQKTADDGATTVVNEQLYSRQLYVLGRDAQVRLQQAHVLITGQINGAAAELAKNVVLAGVASLTLHDDTPCTVGDLSSHLFVRPSHITASLPRSEVTADAVRELNTQVRVLVRQGDDVPLNDEGVGAYSVVVLVNARRSRMEQVGMFCHAHAPSAIPFIAIGSYGVYGFVFSDFGTQWQIIDPDGETPRSGIAMDMRISSHTKPTKTEGEDVKCCIDVQTAESQSGSGLEVGSYVKFMGVKGEGVATTLNDPANVFEVVSTGSYVTDGESSAKRDCFTVALLPVGSDATVSSADFEYLGGGYFEQVKRPSIIEHQSISHSFTQPQLVPMRWDDLTRPQRLHSLLQGILSFQADNNDLPEPHSADHAGDVAQRASVVFQQLNTTDPLTDSQMDELATLASVSAGQLNPMCSFLGGVAGQEVLKACTGKFTPLDQWLHFDAVQCLPTPQQPEEYPSLATLSLTGVDAGQDPSLLRYAAQEAVMGKTFQRDLAKLNLFLVGAGALGCELLKNMGLTGCSSSSPGGEMHKGGKLVVTDMDAIEISNLNRQFLFREKHVGKLKSKVAADAVKDINPLLNVTPMETKVCPQTEDVLADSFWDTLDIVVNALDNVTARLYVDSKCVNYGKPLLESGTLGTKANTLPVVPEVTESYSSDPVQDDDAGGAIPACTLHAYPNLIEHTLTWARDTMFERFFSLDVKEANAFLKATRQGVDVSEGLQEYQRELNRQSNTKLTRLRTARQVLVGIDPADDAEGLFPYSVSVAGSGSEKVVFGLKECVYLARLRFEENFVNRVVQLLAVHPLGKVDSHGKPFWSGARRAPNPECFDVNDDLHLDFVTACTKLYAEVYTVPMTPGDSNGSLGDGNGYIDLDFKALRSVVRSKLLAEDFPAIPEFHPSTDVRIPENDEEAKAMKAAADKKAEDDAASLEEQSGKEMDRLVDMRRRSTNNNNVSVSLLEALSFEKDDDNNCHMAFIHAAANLRARNYGIPEVDAFKSKQVVGRIIPAIATTTAMTTGLIMFELFKLVNKRNDVEAYTCANINLAVNSYAMFEPAPCKKEKFARRNKKSSADGLDMTLWTMVTIEGDCTVQEVVDYFDTNFGFEVMSIGTKGDVTLYSDMFAHTQKGRAERKVSELFTELTGSVCPELYIPLTIDGDWAEESDEGEEEDEDEDEDDELPVPNCRLRWR